MYVLGISAFYHDSAVCLLNQGRILAAAQEERFTRLKHDSSFPQNALDYCLCFINYDLESVKAVAFYDKPFLKFERILETTLTFSPRSYLPFIDAMPIWLKQKLYIKDIIKRSLKKTAKDKNKKINLKNIDIVFPEHHLSHAASAFFSSHYSQAAVLTIDGVGEYSTASYGLGRDNNIEIFADLKFPHSLGLLYSAFTYYLGFEVNDGEYKVMGLAPYGEPKYIQLIKDNLIDIKPDGSLRLNMNFFSFCTSRRMINDKFIKLFGLIRRDPKMPLEQKHMDIAASLQKVVEEVMLNMADNLYEQTGEQNLVLAGGVALNCVANGRVLRESKFSSLWIQPAASDAGGALGAALACWHMYLDNKRQITDRDIMQGCFLGPEFSSTDIKYFLENNNIEYDYIADDQNLYEKVCGYLNDKKIIGWFQGRMEFGPRALGSRSIIADARDPYMQETLNVKVKFREEFRPFAPAVLEEDAQDYFYLKSKSPYMLLVDYVKDERRFTLNDKDKNLQGLDKLKSVRSDINAVTHVDYSARIQTVNKEINPRFWHLLNTFKKLTGYSILVNTSFNVKGEPIVCTPSEAYNCFLKTGMDILVLGNFIVRKR